MEKELSRREKELMFSMAMSLVQALEMTLKRAKEEKLAPETYPGITISIRIILGLLKDFYDKNLKEEKEV